MHNLPAGLLDNRIEFFNDPQDQEVTYCLTNGVVTRINESPAEIQNLIDLDLSAHPDKVEALVYLGYETAVGQREKYCSCCFGAFDGEADYVDGKFIHTEWWPCPKRGTCPVEGKLCNALQVGCHGKALTRREIEVLTQLAQGLLNKEIGAILGISEETVKVHVKHILEKAELMNSKELIKLAYQKNLL